MNIRFLPHFLLVWFAALPLSGQTPSPTPYPTAGGAGGKIITVANLNDSGPGSLREALDTEGPRIIRFAVGGEIWLKDTMKVGKPFVTVEGESAPSPGISLMGDRLRVRTHDVILRNIRVRVGALLTGSDPQNRDGIQIDGAVDGSDPGYNVLVENCSVSWAIDENIQIYGKNNHDIVVRNCIIAEGLQKGHPKGGTHSAGLIVGPDTRNILIQGNLFAHNAFRNPLVGGGGEALVVNNLVYDPGFGGLMIYSGGKHSTKPTLVTAIGNVLVPGASTTRGGGVPRTEIRTYHDSGINPGSKVYYADNLASGILAYSPEEKTKAAPTGEEFRPAVTEPPVPLGNIKPLPASEVEAYVLAHAGARPDDRDEIDWRIVEDVKNRTGKIKDYPTDTRLHPQPAVFTGIQGEYAKLLAKYVTPKGVRYGKWKENSEDMAALQRVADSFASPGEEDLAFLLNAYNAWMLHEVLKEYPLEKGANGPAIELFTTNRIKVAGRETSFDTLEKEIANRFPDPRAVFALNRASRGGPDVSAEPFTKDMLAVQLDRVTGLFINSERAVREQDDKTAISRIFEWRKDQFPKGALGIINQFRHWHARGSEITFQDYDWTLNEAP